MPTLAVEQCEQLVMGSLHAVRVSFQRALADCDEAAAGFVAFETELRVDQLRRITASTLGGSALWKTREGKRYISTENEVEQGVLSLYVGSDRFVTAEMWFEMLCDIVGGKPIRAIEPSIAAIINLAVVEPCLYPQRELSIWLTLAVHVATGADQVDLHGAMPELSTDFDMLYQELPATGRTAAKLRPGSKRVESLPASQMRLLEATRPDLADAIAGMATDEQRTQLFLAHEAELRAYVREHVFAKLAHEFNAADGAFVVLHPD